MIPLLLNIVVGFYCFSAGVVGDLNLNSDPGWKLIYTTRTNVGYILKGSSGKERQIQLTHTDGSPVGVTFDARNNLAYWTDASSYSEAIYRARLDGSSNIEVVADTGLQLPEGISFDWITGNIYFADSNYSHIAVCRNDSSICAVIVQEVIDKPRDIALHPNEGIMFWTDWGKTPAIMRAGMDGSIPLAIVTTNLTWPNGITVDQGNSRIYWVDAHLDRIESSLFNGNDRQIVISQNRIHPFGVDVFGDRIFWSDWSSHEIKSADKYNGSNSKVHLFDPHTLMNGLTLFHMANQPIFRSNPCEKTRCSHICTLSPGEVKFRCFCPAGMVLDNDKTTCVDPENLPKLVIAFKGTLKTMRFNTIGKDVFDTINLPEIKSISAIVYNPINHTLIISDAASKKIYEYNINRTTLSVLIDQDLDSVKGMDIDVVGENLYWVDSGKQRVEAMSFRTGARTVIMNGVENPYDILVISDEGSLYLARMEESEGIIYKMFLNGYSNSVFQRVGDKEPIALAYDEETDNILWADKVSNRSIVSLVSISSDGKSNTQIDLKQDGMPSDIVKFRNQVYWTDMFSRDLKLINIGSQYARLIRPGSFEGNSTKPNNSTNFFAKLTIINRDLSDLEELRNKHDCSMINPKRKVCSHVCLLTGDNFSGVCRCPHGLTLDEDGMICIGNQTLSTCAQDQFTCNDGNCISNKYVCDGKTDCSDHDDEINCNKTTCMKGTFKCESNGVCIPDKWVCDDEHDCDGGDDERNCTNGPCNLDFDFRCEVSNRCIPKSWRCDHKMDCPEGDDSDERGCNFACPDGFFKCATSGHCIVVDWVCDKEKDCDDGSDEMVNCVRKTCSPDQFSCNNGRCIDRKLKCDGLPNCAHDEDEVNCETAVNVTANDQIDADAYGDMVNSTTSTVLPDADEPEIGDKKDRRGEHDSKAAIVLGQTAIIVLGVIVIVLVGIIIALVLGVLYTKRKRKIQPNVSLNLIDLDHEHELSFITKNKINN